MKIASLKKVATFTARGYYAAAIDALDAAMDGETGAGWIKYMQQARAMLAAVSAGQDIKPVCAVMACDGNSKLPFVAFSALPGIGACPGAGSCLTWCYSFKAWRYPAAFLRQLQNTILLSTESGREYILAALDTAAPASAETAQAFRLYVDGDFRTAEELRFWMEALKARPWLAAYGYSKSLSEFMALAESGYIFPSNYLLNLSGGHKHGQAIADAIKSLPVYRGEFEAVSIGRKVKSSDHGKPETNKALREAYGKKAFTCPGKCGECTNAQHACGSARFKGVPIIIAVH